MTEKANLEKKRRGAILLCEPQCAGLEHAMHNAAAIATACLARGDHEIIFLAEPHHLSAVRDLLKANIPDEIFRIEFVPMEIPSRHSAGWRRLRAEKKWITQVDVLARHEVQAVIILSVINTSLWMLRRWMRRRRVTVPVLGVAHGVLASLAQRPPRRPWDRLLSLRRVLLSDWPETFRLLTLGDSIRECLLEIQPELSTKVVSLDHPYFWSRTQPQEPSAGNTLRMGFLGYASRVKGADVFLRLAGELGREVSGAEFPLVGFADAACGLPPELLAGIEPRPLAPMDYSRRVQELTYVLWTGRAEHYRLTASATFLEALSQVKPGIYLRNPYIESYFHRMGDVGYLCDDLDQMRRTVRSILADFPRERYRQQCRNILAGREIFEPKNLAPRLAAILDEIAAQKGGR
jgi:hypothetical protein